MRERSTSTIQWPRLPVRVETHALPDLPYSHAALEPYIDTETMRLHHGAHHKTYVEKLNEALRGSPQEGWDLERILASVSQFPTAVRNNGGGHWNHSFFWEILTPDRDANVLPRTFEEILDRNFGSVGDFKQEFASAAKSVFGSGWAWLIKQGDGALVIGSTANQDNPLMDLAEMKGIPVLGLDVWEHAYYLKHRNKRDPYIDDFWKIVNWRKVEEIYRQSEAPPSLH